MKRGDIYWVRNDGAIGSEARGKRPCIIVSNDKCNEFGPNVNAVMVTSRWKKPLPTHVQIKSTPYVSVAMCEQTDLIDKNRLCGYIGHCNSYEMRKLNKALFKLILLQANLLEKIINLYKVNLKR